MCTVIYIPGNETSYFASLRDESPLRPAALAPEIYHANGIHQMSPKDALKGGTWVGINEFRNVIILLNGAKEKHIQKDNYLKSRGLIVNDLLASELPIVDWSLMNLEGVEPFTLVVWSDESLFELQWDGTQKQRILIDKTVPQIWSSSTLYSTESRDKRSNLFQNWIAMEPPIDKLTLLKFFKSFPEMENGFIMNRNEKVKTLSFSFIELPQSEFASFDYFDLQKYTHHQKVIKLLAKSTDCPLPPDYPSNTKLL